MNPNNNTNNTNNPNDPNNPNNHNNPNTSNNPNNNQFMLTVMFVCLWGCNWYFQPVLVTPSALMFV